MKKLAVIILNWNGRRLLEQFLPDAVARTIDDDTDLYVADNGSEDESLQWIRANCPEVRILELGSNYGFAGGYNRAIAMVEEPYVLLLNSDVEVTPGWTRPLLRFMEATPGAGACQPKILSWREKDAFEYAGAAGGFLDRNGYPYCRGRLFSSVEKDRGQYDGAPAPVCWASGAALLTRRSLYLSLGGLDADFFAHMEEIDYCCRLANAGFGVYAVTDSIVYHVGGASLSYGNPRKTYLNFRNNLLLLHKNLPRKKGRKIVFRRMCLDALAWGMFMAKFDFRNAASIVRAHRDFRRMRKNYTSFPEKDFLSLLPGAGRNILLDFYVKRMKH